MGKFKIEYFVFFITLLLFCIAMSFVVNVPDYDLWARLIVGKHFFQTGMLLKHDIFSYTPTHFWFDHEWGASVIYYAVFKFFGPIGLTVAKGVISFIILLFVSETVKLKYGPKPLYAMLLFCVFVYLACYDCFSATIRCHMFSFLFFSAWLYCLERYRNGDKKLLFYLPFSMILWANIHGGCVSGIGLLLLYALGEFLNKKSYKDYLVAALLSGLATFINPFGPKYVLFLIQATTMKRPLVTEWLSTFNPIYVGKYLKFKAFMLLMLVAPLPKFISVARTWRKEDALISQRNIFKKIAEYYETVDKTKFLVLASTLTLAIMHIKHQPFFVIAAAVFLYEEFTKLFEGMSVPNPDIPKGVVRRQIVMTYVLLFMIAVVTLQFVDKRIKISQYKYPIFSIEFLKVNHIKGNLFINFPYGSYAIYKLYPNNLVEIDGRYEEVYYPELLNELKDFYMVKTKNWKKIITDYKTDVIIVENTYPVFRKLAVDNDWRMIFQDADFSVFVPKNKVADKYKYPASKLDYYEKTQFDTSIDFIQKK